MKPLYQKFMPYVLLAILPSFVACSNGGSLTLEHPLKRGPSTGQSFFTTSLGGHSMVVEQGKTKATGYHGWVGMNAVTQTRLSGMPGNFKVYQDHAPPE